MLLAPLRGHDSPGQRLFSSYPFAALCFTSILEILIISISIIIHVSPGLILCFWTKKSNLSGWPMPVTLEYQAHTYCLPSPKVPTLVHC